MNHQLPSYILRYFWGDNQKELSWQKHQKYITKTILEKGDRKAVSWLIKRIDREKLSTQLKSLKLDPKSENFWQQYLS